MISRYWITKKQLTELRETPIREELLEKIQEEQFFSLDWINKEHKRFEKIVSKAK